jgi:hypothetical protein
MGIECSASNASIRNRSNILISNVQKLAWEAGSNTSICALPNSALVSTIMWHLECKTCYLQDASKRTFDADKVTVDPFSSSDREVARALLKRVESLCDYLYARVAVGHDLCGHKKFMQDTYLLSE